MLISIWTQHIESSYPDWLCTSIKSNHYIVSKNNEAGTYRLGFGSHWLRWALCRADQLTDSSSHQSHVGGSKPERRRKERSSSQIQKS